MLRFNNFPPTEQGDVELTEAGRDSLIDFTERCETGDRGGDKTYQRLRGAVEAISSTVVANSTETSFDKLVDIIDPVFDALEVSGKAQEVIMQHSRKAITKQQAYLRAGIQ